MVSCCAESGEILILPREGGYRDLIQDPSSALGGDVVSSLDSQVEFGELGGELAEGLSSLRTWPFVLEVPESEVEDRLLVLERDPRIAAATRNWRVSLRIPGSELTPRRLSSSGTTFRIALRSRSGRAPRMWPSWTAESTRARCAAGGSRPYS